MILCVIVALVFVRSIFEARYEHALLCLLVFILFWIPSMLERRFTVEIPAFWKASSSASSSPRKSSDEIDAFYIKIPFWDTILHTTWGFLAAGIGFALVDILNRSHATRLQLAPHLHGDHRVLLLYDRGRGLGALRVFRWTSSSGSTCRKILS